jgi:hypothetical protein
VTTVHQDATFPPSPTAIKMWVFSKREAGLDRRAAQGIGAV